MKSILLASASVLVLAGTASADVDWAGVATLGYNDGDNTTGDNQGFYWDLEIDVTLSQTLDNGLTAGATFGFEAVDDTPTTSTSIVINDNGTPLDPTDDYPEEVTTTSDNALGQDITVKDYVLFVESDTAGLFFGNTAFAAETRWTSAGDMEADKFSEQDGETALRGDFMVAGIEASLSYVISDTEGDAPTGEDLAQMSLGATGTFGTFTVGVAYQEDEDSLPGNDNGDFTVNEVFGVFGTTSFAGADVTLAYAETSSSTTAGAKDSGSSLGVQVAYPFGPVTVTGYFVSEDGDSGSAGDNLGLLVSYEDGPISVSLDLDDDQGTFKYLLEGSYDLGNGVVVYAGILNENEGDEDYYLAGALDLGGGASLLVSYAIDDDLDQDDEIGSPEYQEGLTVEAAFEF